MYLILACLILILFIFYRYHTLLEEFQGLKDFTDAERDLKSEPNLKDDLLEQIDSLVLEKTQINERYYSIC